MLIIATEKIEQIVVRQKRHILYFVSVGTHMHPRYA